MVFDNNLDFSKIYSFSKLDLFVKCPQLYFFSNISPIYSKMKNKLKNYPANIFSFNTIGKAVHNAITLYYHLSLKERTSKNLHKCLEQSWFSEAMRFKKMPLGKWGGFKNIEEERIAFKDALIMLSNFQKITDTNFEIEFLPTDDLKNSINDYKALIKPLNEKYDISGKFDLVGNKSGLLNIIDFKTSKREDVNEFQLRFYKLLAELNFKKPVKSTSFYFLRTGSIKEINIEKTNTEDIKKEVLQSIEKINSTKNFTQNVTKLCKFCIYKTFCPENKKVEEIINSRKEKEYDYSDDLPF